MEKLCPFVGKSYEECHCTNLRSDHINMALYFCTKNFRYCEIYKRINLLKRKDAETLASAIDNHYGSIKEEVKKREKILSGFSGR